jgi:hypothetical protein
MNSDIADALAPLIGLPLWGAGRTGDIVRLQFGARRTVGDHEGGSQEVGAYALQLACPWRLVDERRLLVGSGDLLTPADPDAEIETFDWDEPGANWLDLRLAELWTGFGAEPPSVTGAQPDPYTGFVLELSGARRLEVFPNSTPTGHVTTEFWRLLQPGTRVPHFVVGTFGIERDDA